MLISSGRSALFFEIFEKGKFRTAVFPIVQKEAVKMENEKKELNQEKEDPKPLTDEEFKEYQEKDARTTKKVLRFFKAI